MGTAAKAASVLDVWIRYAAETPTTAPTKQAGALHRNCSRQRSAGDFFDSSATASASRSVLTKKNAVAPASVGTTSMVQSSPTRRPPAHPAEARVTAVATMMFAMLNTVR